MDRLTFLGLYFHFFACFLMVLAGLFYFLTVNFTVFTVVTKLKHLAKQSRSSASAFFLKSYD